MLGPSLLRFLAGGQLLAANPALIRPQRLGHREGTIITANGSGGMGVRHRFAWNSDSTYGVWGAGKLSSSVAEEPPYDLPWSARPQRPPVVASPVRGIALLKEGVAALPNQYPEVWVDVELLAFTEPGPKLALRSCSPTSHDGQVYVTTNRVISHVPGQAGFPVPRMPVAMPSASAG